MFARTTLALVACFGFACGDSGELVLSADRPAAQTPEQYGELLFQQMGCHACHSIATAPGTGGPLTKIDGSTRRLAGGRSMIADDDYLRRAILEPSAEVAEGYEDVMPSYAESLNGAQVDALIAFLETLE